MFFWGIPCWKTETYLSWTERWKTHNCGICNFLFNSVSSEIKQKWPWNHLLHFQPQYLFKVFCHSFSLIDTVSHTMDTLQLEWLDLPIDLDPGVMLLDFKLSDVTLYNCSQNYTAGKKVFSWRNGIKFHCNMSKKKATWYNRYTAWVYEH